MELISTAASPVPPTLNYKVSCIMLTHTQKIFLTSTLFIALVKSVSSGSAQGTSQVVDSWAVYNKHF